MTTLYQRILNTSKKWRLLKLEIAPAGIVAGALLRRVLVCGCVFLFSTRAENARGDSTNQSHARAAKIYFAQEVRPILAGHCFKCHGQDEATRKAKLRLDVRAEALKPAKSDEIAIVLGKPDKSELVRRILTESEDDVMPPPETKKPLTAEEKEVLQRWISEGAEYKAHWAFLPPKQSPLPKVRDKAWPQNDIDSFVLARLEKEGLKPSPRADKYTLVRRVYLDLTGLPPTPAEADAFANDGSTNAFERLVDRLLASSHYGERWARRWLDLARYADTNGYEKDRERSIWPWRDWVINSLNAGKPLPPSVIAGQRYAFIRPAAAVLGPQFKFSKHGQSGAELSEALPHLAGVVDEICLIKSMRTDQFNHAPDLMDLKQESKETLEMYGCDPDKPSFARACLLARRMIERGMRFVNIYDEGWDAHSDVLGNSKDNCGKTDKASAALVKDLKQRGLLDETLVIWGGEFGRTPMVESNAALGRSLGRDHHPQAFTVWLAGGGIKAGLTHGATDEMGFHVVQDEVHVHDLQATILHCLGFDHERLTYTYQGRQFRLTDVHGQVVEKILA